MDSRFFDRLSVVKQLPTRTCVGCRKRVSASALLRTTILRRSPAEASTLVLDVKRRLGGRGAWVCPSPACVLGAGRKKSFARALRHPGPVDYTAVLEAVMAVAEDQSTEIGPNMEGTQRK